MTMEDKQLVTDQAPLTNVPLPDGLPQGSEVQRIAHSTEQFAILVIPTSAVDNHELVTKARAWVDAVAVDHSAPSLLLALQGAQIVWSPGRTAILGQADRLDTIRQALIEFSGHESELRDIERDIGVRWPHLETDSPWAFDCDEKGLARRPELARRFQQTLALRARLARLAPHAHRPHIHPPTLASQIGERLRERTRLAERLDFSSDSLEVFENVYELCGQRASEYALARKGHTLEWIIIVLLVAQTILALVERLATLGS